MNQVLLWLPTLLKLMLGNHWSSMSIASSLETKGRYFDGLGWGLPECELFDWIGVVTEKLTKMRNYIPSNIILNALGLAEMAIQDVIHLHGLPSMIVSD
jgi:hypothetical protein